MYKDLKLDEKMVMVELEKLLRFLAYNFRKVTIKKLKEEFEDCYCLQDNIKFNLTSEDSYTLFGAYETEQVSFTNDLQTDLINLAKAVVNAIYGPNNEIVKCQEFYQEVIVYSIKFQFKMGLEDVLTAKKASEEYDYYHSLSI